MNKISFLIFGDIVGKIGRKALIQKLTDLKKRYKPDLTIANVENLAHGRGITERSLLEIREAGVEAFTSGHHVFENERGLPLLTSPKWADRLIRPANVNPKYPGKGWMQLEVKDQDVWIGNLHGQLFMPMESSSPFLAFDRFWNEHGSNASKPVVIVDLHAETTSEKVAFANYVDGRAAIVFGTHTHVPTADAKVLPNGTAFVSDVGMVGAYDSVIGFEKNSSIERFLNVSTSPYKIKEKGACEINGLIVIMDLDTHQVVGLDRIREIVDI